MILNINDKATKPIIYAIYLILPIIIYTKSLASLLIIKFKNCFFIFG